MAKAIGLDIGSRYIRIVELAAKKNNWEIQAYGATPSPLQSSVYTSDEEKKALAKAIKALIKETKVATKLVNISLPESQVFTQIIHTPYLSQKELKSAMKWQAEQYIPLPLKEVSYDYHVIEADKKQQKMRVLISAAPLTITGKYIDLLESAGLIINSVETQILSMVRAVSRLISEGAIATIINLGYTSTDFAFTTKEGILLTRTLSSGGKALTRAISQQLRFNEEQAERYKLTYGIDSQQLEGKVYAAVKPLLDQFLKELNKSFVFFKEQYPNKKIDLVLVCGGGALMPGLVRFMTESFGIETQRAEPFSGLTFKKGISAPSISSTEYSVATGLAMRK